MQKRKLLDELRGSARGITRCSMTEITICFHIVSGDIRIKIEHVFGMIKFY